MPPDLPELTEELRRERDLYLSLLELGKDRHPATFLQEALALLTELTHATSGYLELFPCDASDSPTAWSAAQGLSEADIDQVRELVSRGIIAQAISSGSTIVTPAAFLDPRFDSFASVAQHRLGAVLCCPIGSDPPRGILYLYGHTESGGFLDSEVHRVETVARHLAPLADRLVAERCPPQEDQTREVRARLRAQGVVGRSAALGRVLEQVAMVAGLEVSVLFTGASGTGKSQLARLLHDHSRRAAEPFVELNCAAMPDTLLESELFGALAGAHSTAARNHEGKVQAADRGTLFLDEVGELSLSAQAKLLQFLDTREYFPLGSNKPRRADVRLLAATNSDLDLAVKERRFRDDLYYRLKVLPIRVPTLAERREDIPELAEAFCRDACGRHSLPHLTVSRNAVRALEAAEWPGNVRQLRHVVEAACIRAASEAARQVEASHLFLEGEPATGTGASLSVAALTFQEATRRFQADLLRTTLEETDWNIPEAARRLDVARSHLYSLVRAFGLARTSGRS